MGTFIPHIYFTSVCASAISPLGSKNRQKCFLFGNSQWENRWTYMVFKRLCRRAKLKYGTFTHCLFIVLWSYDNWQDDTRVSRLGFILQAGRKVTIWSVASPILMIWPPITELRYIFIILKKLVNGRSVSTP